MKKRTLKALSIILLTALFLCGELGQYNVIYAGMTAGGFIAADDSIIVSGLSSIAYNDLNSETQDFVSTCGYETSELAYYIASTTPATYDADGSRSIYI